MGEAYFVFDLVQQQIALEDAQERRRIANVMKSLRDDSDLFALPEKEFRANFRLSREGARRLIGELEPHLPQAQRHLKLPTTVRVLCALQFFSNGSYQRVVGKNIHTPVSQASVSRCVRDVTIAMQRIAGRWIRFPQNDMERNSIKTKFLQRHGMQNIVGIIDGTHIAIVTPKYNERLINGVWEKVVDPFIERLYVNRKSYHSINAQIICDADMKIIGLNAKFPGSTHDAFVWRSCIVKETMRVNYRNGDVNSVILGDSGYPQQPWLFTPVSNPADDSPEQRYNNTFVRTRCLVERCIGLLKARFRCLLKDRTLHYLPRKAAQIIISCAVLHNMAIHFNGPEEFAPAYDELDNQRHEPHEPMGDEVDAEVRREGERVRRTYIDTYFN